jgi:hypothetical protein
VRITIVGRYEVGGTVAGLTGGGLALTVNGANPLNIAADGPYNFPDRFRPGDNFSVVVATQPAGQTCSVTTGSGVIANSDYHGAFVSCASNTPKIVRAANTLGFGEFMRSLDVSPGGAGVVACFTPSSTKGDFVLTLGVAHYELQELPGIEPPSGCGMHLVTVDEDAEHVYVMDIRTNMVSAYKTH